MIDFTNCEINKFKYYGGKNGYGTELSEVLETIEQQQIYDTKDLKAFFWNMFIADSLVGNFDRHNGNWGFMINEKLQKIDIAPIYDCASCLYPQLTDERIFEILNNQEEMEARVFVFPTSALKINNREINYFDYISSLKDKECNQALVRIYPLINMEKIYEIIDNTPFISNIRKEFYKKILNLRYKNILQYSFEKLCNKD